MDAETALKYEPELDEEEDDELGFYEDGVKRTLTDEQIEMFRHSETEQLVREGKMERQHQPTDQLNDDELMGSPVSDASSVEDDLLGLSRPANLTPHAGHTTRQPLQSSRSDATLSTNVLPKQRKQEVPYDQRNKRKWEDYIEENDPVEGSLTHRRMARELDELREESVDLDY